MPLIVIATGVDNIKINVWHIQESESELYSLYSEQCGMNSDVNPVSFPLESRRKQWMACRLALNDMLEKINYNVRYTPVGKPYIEPRQIGAISFSHTAEYAAVALNTNGSIGLDIEKLSSRIQRVKERFLSNEELRESNHDIHKLVTYWTAKESLFKYTDLSELDFSNNLLIKPFIYTHTPFTINGTITKGVHHENIDLRIITLNDHIIAYTL